MAEIRPYRADDLEALYDICLKTGEAGQDATALYRDGRRLGHIYAAPYGVLEPESCFVVEDKEGVGGYIVGTRNTFAFEKRMEAEWWPALRTQIAEGGDDDAADQRALSGASPHQLLAAAAGHGHGQAPDRHLARGNGRGGCGESAS